MFKIKQIGVSEELKIRAEFFSIAVWHIICLYMAGGGLTLWSRFLAPASKDVEKRPWE